jgi:plasmid stabilization system protein ParE
MRVVFLPQAREEILESAAYYRDRSRLAVEKFSADIAGTIDLLLQFPGVGSPILRNARRLILKNFPYQLSIGWRATTSAYMPLRTSNGGRAIGKRDCRSNSTRGNKPCTCRLPL